MLDFYSNYNNCILIGDFNANPLDKTMSTFVQDQGLYNHMKQKACWKSKNGTCIDLILSNQKSLFQHTNIFETGLSDHLMLIYTMLKTTYQHLPPSNIKYRCYKNFNTNYFLEELQFVTSYLPVGNYTEFDNAFKSVLDKHAPLKTKFIRGNNKPHMTKALRKAIMKRSHLKSIANKTKKSNDMQAYKKQRNVVVNLNKKAKRNLFNSIEVSPNQGSKTFWKVCKPLLSTKSNSGVGRILLIENNDILSDDKSIATVFNEYFNCITNNLDLEKWDTCTSSLFNDPVSQAVRKYSNHPSIQKIKAKFNNQINLNLCQQTKIRFIN